mmetsp:Transcript_57417/g.158925  ORF Transcript_57417/g.158925 Transcript_57417/m.158925 type:complete len:214 (+) Transcript_57417:111-752(+)
MGLPLSEAFVDAERGELGCRSGLSPCLEFATDRPVLCLGGCGLPLRHLPPARSGLHVAVVPLVPALRPAAAGVRQLGERGCLAPAGRGGTRQRFGRGLGPGLPLHVRIGAGVPGLRGPLVRRGLAMVLLPHVPAAAQHLPARFPALVDYDRCARAAHGRLYGAIDELAGECEVLHARGGSETLSAQGPAVRVHGEGAQVLAEVRARRGAGAPG